jgi:hypothetical protein
VHLVLPDVVRLGRQQQEDEEPLEVRLEGEGLRVLPVQRPGPLAQYCALGGGSGRVAASLVRSSTSVPVAAAVRKEAE